MPEILDLDGVLANLPVGRQFCFIDAALSYDPGRAIKTRKTYSEEHPWIHDHFTDGPKLVPGVILVEQLCQSGVLLGVLSGHSEQGESYVLGRLQARFLSPAYAPCTVHASVEIEACMQDVLGFRGKAMIADQLLLELDFIAKPYERQSKG